MSVNYYIYTKDLEMAFDLMPRVTMNQHRRAFEIHICQTVPDAFGFKPLFEDHSYHSFEELENILLDEKYYFVIENEYGVRYEPKEFIKMMKNFNEKGKYRTDGKYSMDKDGFQFMDGEFF